ncbi:MAG: hypothetical protein QOI83_964, partial [Streptomycetaceae bacterium]|nr:hypothetical protein [Streptomycetaceae bacterium]
MTVAPFTLLAMGGSLRAASAN